LNVRDESGDDRSIDKAQPHVWEIRNSPKLCAEP